MWTKIFFIFFPLEILPPPPTSFEEPDFSYLHCFRVDSMNAKIKYSVGVSLAFVLQKPWALGR